MIVIDNTSKLIEEKVIKETALEFSLKVENLVWDRDISYIEAVLQLVDQGTYELETIPKLLTKEILIKIQDEASERKLLKNMPQSSLVKISKFFKTTTK